MIPTVRRQSQENENFKGSLGYIWNVSLAWDTRDLVSKNVLEVARQFVSIACVLCMQAPYMCILHIK